MGSKYKILVLGSLNEKLDSAVEEAFEISYLPLQQLDDADFTKGRQALLIGSDVSDAQQAELLAGIGNHSDLGDIPHICLNNSASVDLTLQLFNSGADDVLTPSDSSKEIIVRINKAVVNNIANRQLKQQLKTASSVAMDAMTYTGDLGINVQFLLDSADCDNFDQLGQRLFQALNHYSLRCSLQIRGRFEEKNMELNGIARDLESQLMHHFKDVGRFHESGKRLFVNFDQVSLLVKNMPIEDEQRCGKLRDNLFHLLQGAETQVKSLDVKSEVERDIQLLKRLSTHMQNTLLKIEEDYSNITSEIAAVVDDSTDKIVNALNHLGLTEEQELTILTILDKASEKTQEIFNRGLQVDISTNELLMKINEVVSSAETRDCGK